MEYSPPIPNLKISLHDLLHEKDILHNGFLQKRVDILGKSLPIWRQYYAVIHNGCLYLYNNIKATKPNVAISLYGYHRISSITPPGETSTVQRFELVPVQPTMKMFTFSVPAESELNLWMQRIKSALYFANGHRYNERNPSSSSESSSLEEPVHVPALEKISRVQSAGIDSDGSEDYEKIDDDELFDMKKMKEEIHEAKKTTAPYVGEDIPLPSRKKTGKFSKRKEKIEKKEKEVDECQYEIQTEPQSDPQSKSLLSSPSSSLPIIPDTGHPPQAPVLNTRNDKTITTKSQSQLAKPAIKKKPVPKPKPKLSVRFHDAEERSQPDGSDEDNNLTIDATSAIMDIGFEKFWDNCFLSQHIPNASLEANRLLSQIAVNGMYLIRCGASKGGFTLCTYLNGTNVKYTVIESKAGYTIGEDKFFPKVFDLVAHYQDNDLPGRLNQRLTMAIGEHTTGRECLDALVH